MKRKIRLTESQLDTVIHHKLLEQSRFASGRRQEFGVFDTGDCQNRKGQMNEINPEDPENPRDNYHPYWDEEDTILSWYCTKYCKDDDLRALGLGHKELETDPVNRYSGLGELANYVIGTTKFSLSQQMRNMRFLAGMSGGLASVSNLQKKVYAKYKDMPEEQLRQICLDIIDKRNQDEIFKKFIVKWREKEGASATNRKIKTEKEKREEFKKDSEKRLYADLARMKGISGKVDMSRFKSIGTRPKGDLMESEETITNVERQRRDILRRMGL
jgi:hypothetical protein